MSSSTCLKAELLRPKGAAEGKGKAGPLEAGGGEDSPPASLEGTMVFDCKHGIWTIITR